MSLSQKASWSVGSQCQPRERRVGQVVPVQSLITEAGGRRRQEAACLIAMPGFFLPTTSVSRPEAQVRRRGEANPLLGQPQQAPEEPQPASKALCLHSEARLVVLKEMDHPAFLQQDTYISKHRVNSPGPERPGWPSQRAPLNHRLAPLWPKDYWLRGRQPKQRLRCSKEEPKLGQS